MPVPSALTSVSGQSEHRNCSTDETMKLILIRKLADVMDGVDVSNHQVGDVMDLAPGEADVLIAEGWVIEDRRTRSLAPGMHERRRPRPAAPATLEQHLNRAS